MLEFYSLQAVWTCITVFVASCKFCSLKKNNKFKLILRLDHRPKTGVSAVQQCEDKLDGNAKSVRVVFAPSVCSKDMLACFHVNALLLL